MSVDCKGKCVEGKGIRQDSLLTRSDNRVDEPLVLDFCVFGPFASARRTDSRK